MSDSQARPLYLPHPLLHNLCFFVFPVYLKHVPPIISHGLELYKIISLLVTMGSKVTYIYLEFNNIYKPYGYNGYNAAEYYKPYAARRPRNVPPIISHGPRF
jgi:hypothetical protein